LNVAQQFHDVGHQVVVEGDVVVVTAIAGQGPVLRPATIGLLGGKDQFQALAKGRAVLLDVTTLVDFGQEAHFHGGGCIVEAGTPASIGLQRGQFRGRQYVQLVVFHPPTVGFLHTQHDVGYGLRLG